MKMLVERKPTAHTERACDRCSLCDKVIKKGELVLYVNQAMYPGTRAGNAHIKCIIRIAKKLEAEKNGNSKMYEV